MNKEELVKKIQELRLEKELESLILELIENAPEVNQTLLNTIAQILELQAHINDRLSTLFNEEAKNFESRGV